jgi:hypothetical protein
VVGEVELGDVVGVADIIKLDVVGDADEVAVSSAPPAVEGLVVIGTADSSPQGA